MNEATDYIGTPWRFVNQNHERLQARRDMAAIDREIAKRRATDYGEALSTKELGIFLVGLIMSATIGIAGVYSIWQAMITWIGGML